jgi:2-aminoadipate transaminase
MTKLRARVALSGCERLRRPKAVSDTVTEAWRMRSESVRLDWASMATTISFARGVPAPECLAVDELADCARTVLERDGARVLPYGGGGGYGPLREWLAERHAVEPGQVVVTNGSLEAFLFLARRLLADGRRRVLVEAPTYDRPLKLLAELGAEVVAVPQDDDGLDLEALEGALGGGRDAPAFLYTIPTFQNPSGRTLAPDRRRRLVELAREHDLIVLEDDPYGLVRYEGDSLPSLHVLDGGERVVYASSFSKTVAPGLRVGYLVLPDARLATELETVANGTYISPVLLGQATVLEFVSRGRFEPNLERVRSLLGARRDAMLAALERVFPAGARWSRPEGGYFVWLDLPDGVDAAALLERAERGGVTFVKGADFFPAGAGGRSAARLAFSYVSPAEIDEGVARLAAALPAPAAV